MATTTPESIGNFKIVSKLGQGGMGAVFHAIHGTLERPVALKILPSEFANNPEYVVRFLREARTIATLRHENIVQVYDAGEQNGQYYIAMEMVDGCHLLAHLEQKKKLTEEEGVALLLQAAQGLSAAHAKGLVHRDIKPENMLLGKDNVLRIVDFGLVMESTSTTQLTATGACLGTPMYMSPEQADGEMADARTDIYSLGISFYRILTGQPPFSSPTVMNLLFKHKFEAPPNPKTIRSDLSDDICNLLLRMMAKRREDRPQTAQAVLEMINALKQGNRITAPPAFVPAAAETSSVTFAGHSLSFARFKPSMTLKFYAVAALVLIVIAAVFISRSIRRSDAPASVADPSNAAATKIAQLMKDAESFENDGKLDEAAKLYAEAVSLDNTSTAKHRLQRVTERLSKPQTIEANTVEREKLTQKAIDAEAAGQHDIAAEHYRQASLLAEGSLRTTLADKSAHCKRQDYLSKAAIAENKRDYKAAVHYYDKALELKADPLVSEKLATTRRLLEESAAEQQTERTYANAMTKGQAALDRGDFQDARVQFGVASALKPNSPEIAAKLNELEQKENTAKRGSIAEIVKRIEAHVLNERDAEALTEAQSALRTDPANAELKRVKAALEDLQSAVRAYSAAAKTADDAIERATEARDIEGDTAFSDYKATFRGMREKFIDKSKKLRISFLDHSYGTVSAAPKTARSDVEALTGELASAAKTCDRRADSARERKSVGAKIPYIGRVEVKTDSRSADRYRQAAEAFRKLAADAKRNSAE